MYFERCLWPVPRYFLEMLYTTYFSLSTQYLSSTFSEMLKAVFVQWHSIHSTASCNLAKTLACT